MKVEKKRISTWLLITLLGGIILIFRFGWLLFSFVRRFYEYLWFPFISKIQRKVSGELPISLGDLLYLIAGLWFLFTFISIVRNFFLYGLNRNRIIKGIKRLILLIFGIYILFMLLWGFNYHVNRLEQDFNVRLTPYNKTDLDSLCFDLMHKLNLTHHLIKNTSADKITFIQNPVFLFLEADKLYKKSALKRPPLSYSCFSIKPALFGNLLNYAGIEGYYNPFTGEAQVNTKIPGILQPFVVCHEIAHQLGFAQEYAANFVGYYVASRSGDPQFRYSAYLQMFLYSFGELRLRDSSRAKLIWYELKNGVRKDIYGIREFYLRHQNSFDPMLTHIYDNYLKANNQELGIESYDEVTALLIDFRRHRHSL